VNSFSKEEELSGSHLEGGDEINESKFRSGEEIDEEIEDENLGLSRYWIFRLFEGKCCDMEI
jgi:hypothetical protein